MVTFHAADLLGLKPMTGVFMLSVLILLPF